MSRQTTRRLRRGMHGALASQRRCARKRHSAKPPKLFRGYQLLCLRRQKLIYSSKERPRTGLHDRRGTSSKSSANNMDKLVTLAISRWHPAQPQIKSQQQQIVGQDTSGVTATRPWWGILPWANRLAIIGPFGVTGTVQCRL